MTLFCPEKEIFITGEKKKKKSLTLKKKD